MAVAVDNSSERQYHNATSPYVLPNDAIERNRLDAQAAAIVEMIGGAPCLAPIRSMESVCKAVDVGCGTGIATIQIASMFPSAKVYGLDLSPIPEATQKMAPANAAWAVGNVLDVDGNQPRDDVMSREIFRPGGLDYIFGQHQDLDWKFYRVGTLECLSEQWEWHRAVISGAEQSGLSTRAGSDAASIMKDAGLEIISVQSFEFSFVPSNKTPNSRAMGRYVQAKLVPQYPELLRKMLAAQGITGEELERLNKDSLRDIASEEGIHQKYTVTIARKL